MSKLPENLDDGVVKVLLSKGANVNAEDSRGRTPLHIATLQGNTEAVLQLLSKDDIELNVNNNNYYSLIPYRVSVFTKKT